MVRKPFLPIRGDQPAFGQAFDIGRKCQRDDVGRQPIGDCSGLTRRTAVRLLNAHPVSRLRLILGDEFGIDLLIDLTRGVIGNVEELAFLFSSVVLKSHQSDRDGRQDQGKGIKPFCCCHTGNSSLKRHATRASHLQFQHFE